MLYGLKVSKRKHARLSIASSSLKRPVKARAWDRLLQNSGKELASVSQLGDIVGRLERLCCLLEAAVVCYGNHSEGESSRLAARASSLSVVVVPGV